MKRFGNAILDPRHVRAVAPCRSSAPSRSLHEDGTVRLAKPPTHYEVLFLDGSRIDLDADSAVALMAELVSPVTTIHPPAKSAPTQP